MRSQRAVRRSELGLSEEAREIHMELEDVIWTIFISIHLHEAEYLTGAFSYFPAQFIWLILPVGFHVIPVSLSIQSIGCGAYQYIFGSLLVAVVVKQSSAPRPFL